MGRVSFGDKAQHASQHANEIDARKAAPLLVLRFISTNGGVLCLVIKSKSIYPRFDAARETQSSTLLDSIGSQLGRKQLHMHNSAVEDAIISNYEIE